MLNEFERKAVRHVEAVRAAFAATRAWRIDDGGMRMGTRLATMLFTALALVGAIGGLTYAGPTAAQRCASSKIKAAAKKSACLLSLDARQATGVAVDPAKVQACKNRLEDPAIGAFARAEAKGGCLTTGDAAPMETKIDAFVDDIVTALNVGTPNACQAQKIQAAGKTARCLLLLDAKAATGGGLDPARVQACQDKLSGPAGTFAKAEARGGCGTTGDAATIEMKVDAFVDDVVAEEPSASSCAMAGCPAPVACDLSAGPCWQPALQSRWQYQLQAAETSSGDCKFGATGGIDAGISAIPFIGSSAVSPVVFDIDFLMDPLCAPGSSNDVDDTAAVNAVHANGAHAICYVDAGTYEPFRPDQQGYVDFDSQCGGCLLGKPVSGFRQERWLNITDMQGQRTFILGVVSARLDRCKADGFDAVEFDNVEGYANATGFAISDGAQLVFNTSLANLAHTRGLTAALKNDLGQVPELVSYFDMAINEQCQEFTECAALDPFLNTGKAVFQVEYQGSPSGFCPQANATGRSTILKTVDLFDTPWTPCR